ncbi:MBL fold metallo-hydrolase [Helcococcus sueciensis]
MKIVTLSSGSSGNCIYVESDKTKLLVDCGLTGKLAITLMQEAGINPYELNAIFVTHEHIDHVKGVGVLSRKFNLPIFANEATWLSMQKKIGKIESHNINVFKSNTFFNFRDLDVHNLSTFHNAKDPVFFVFYQRNQKISILTDTGIVSNTIVDAVKHSDILILESNHDMDMLLNGPYSYDLKMRIKSDFGHLSNDLASEIMDEIVSGNGEHLILGHLSKNNNTEEIARKNMTSTLESKGLKVGKEIILDIAKEYQVGKIIDLGGNYS